MILSSAALAGATLLALLAYLVVAQGGAAPRRLQQALLLGLLAHLAALVIDIAGLDEAPARAHFGFAPALSATLWMVIAVYMIESRLLPLAGARRMLAVLGALGVLLGYAFQGVPIPSVSPWEPLHWLLGLASYGLFGAAVLHAVLLNRAEARLRLTRAGASLEPAEVPQMPLLRLERLTFQFVAAGEIVLTLAILLGAWFTPQWHWDHKTLFALLGWAVVGGLLIGRGLFGLRGPRATRWIYVGAALLLLSYAGSRFVLEVVLHRPFPHS
ncbi:MAG: cytochrome c biogenesis protein CcsA [Pelomonas sp.]|nr:cytochrome c biogenesis protein CcsA [Roseateles sp.]